jgi:hypothetical protein
VCEAQIFKRHPSPTNFESVIFTIVMPPKRAKGQKYSQEQLANLRYTIRKPDSLAKKKESLFGRRLVTYERAQHHKRELNDARQARAAAIAGQNAAPAQPVVRRKAKSGGIPQYR